MKRIWLLLILVLIAALSFLKFTIYDGGLDVALRSAQPRDAIRALYEEAQSHHHRIFAPLTTSADLTTRWSLLRLNAKAKAMARKYTDHASTFDDIVAWSDQLIIADKQRNQYVQQLIQAEKSVAKSLIPGEAAKNKAFFIKDVHTRWNRYAAPTREACERIMARVMTRIK